MVELVVLQLFQVREIHATFDRVFTISTILSFQPEQRDLAQMDSLTSKLMLVEENLRQERVRNRMMEDKVRR